MKSAVITPCSHFFHAGCLKKWLYVQETCPLCHAQLKSQSPAASVPADVPPANQNPGGQGDMAAVCNAKKDEATEKEREEGTREEEEGPSGMHPDHHHPASQASSASACSSSSRETDSHQTTDDVCSSSSTPDTLDMPCTPPSRPHPLPASTLKQSSSQMKQPGSVCPLNRPEPRQDQPTQSDQLAGLSEECSPLPCSL